MNVSRCILAGIVAIVSGFCTNEGRAQSCAGNPANLLVPFSNDGTWTQVARGDDNSLGPVNLPFTFTLYNTAWSQAFINNNGNITFGRSYGEFNAAGFPSAAVPPMIAPFWADVDTRPVQSGQAWYKTLGANAFAVTWVNVGYYNRQVDRLNTFQVVLSDGTSEIVGIGRNIAFAYDNMCWTTGSSSGGSGGFGGTPATVGVNAGNGTDYIQIGRFNQNNANYDGPFNADDGVDYLDGRRFVFDASTTNIPPIPENFPPNNTVNVAAGGAPLDLSVRFLSPEAGQTTEIAITDLDGAASRGLVWDLTSGNVAGARFQWSPDCCVQGSYRVRLVATDSFDPAGRTEVVLQINATCDDQPPTASAGSAYSAACSGVLTAVPLSSAGTTDPDTPLDQLRYQWGTNIPGATFDDPTVAMPTLFVPSAPGCVVTGSVSLVVSDASCSSPTAFATLQISDGSAPVVIPPGDIEVQGSVSGNNIQANVNPGSASVTDQCDAQPGVQGRRSDGQSLDSPYRLGTTTITWTGTDDCGRTANATQRIVVTAPPLPDLTTEVTSVPLAEGFQGQTFSVGWRVRNQGDAAPIAAWSDRVFMSLSADGSGAVAIGDPLSNPRGLPPGDSYERVQPVRLPETPGTYYLFVSADANDQVLERLNGGEANNRGFHSSTIVVRRRPTPDLTVTSVVPPADGILSGSVTTVRFQVANLGTGGTSVPVWYDSVYLLAEDQSLPAPPVCLNLAVATFLGQFQNPSYLPAPGGGDNVYAQEVSVRLPSDISGRYRLAVYTDNFIGNRVVGCGGRVGDVYGVGELDESNNVIYSAPFTIDLEPQPDLVPLSPGVSGSTIVFTGVESTFTWTTQNRAGGPPLGGATDVGFWFDRVYLSRNSDPVIGQDDIAFDLVRAGTGAALLPGQSWPGSFRVRIPLNLPGGLYFVKVRADAQNQVSEFGFESNNLAVSAQPIDVRVTPPIDPAPTSVGVGGSITAVPQQSVTFGWEVVNEGAPPPGFVQTWSDAVYLSLDDVLDPSDRQVVSADAATVQNGDGTVTFPSYVRSRSYVIPDNLPQGAYRVIVRTDDRGAIFESEPGEANNVLVSDDILTISRDQNSAFADLEAVVTVAPPSGGARGSVAGEVGWRVTNRGGGQTQVARWVDRVYLSTNSSPSGGTLVGAVTRTQGLAPGASYTDASSISIPARLPLGTYYLIVVADADGGVVESDEANNAVIASASFVVSEDADNGGGGGGGGGGGVEYADLVVAAASGPTGTIDAGVSINVSASILNQGEASTTEGGWADRMYLSRSASSLVGAIQIGNGRTRTKDSEPDEAYDIALSGTIPLDAEGEYFVLAFADADGTVVETANANNVGPANPPRLTVRGRPQANLVPMLIASDSQASAGQFLRVNGTVANMGAGPTNRADWRDAVYLSPDQFFDGTAGGDLLLGYVPRSGVVDALGNYEILADLPVPAGLSGAYYVILRVNADNAVNEAGLTDDNTLSSLGLVDITIPPPSDLTVATVTSPGAVVLGEPGAYGWRLENAGGQPISGSWTDGVFLSRDRLWSPDDKRLGNFAVRPGQPVQPGQSANGSATPNTPGVLPGDYHVVVRSDVFNAVPETNEANNTGSSEGTVSVSAIPLSPGVPYEGDLAQGRETYFQFDVPAGETVRLTLTHDDPLAWTELYTAFGRVPSTGDFDQIFDNPGQSRQVVTIPTTEAGRYYALARCARGGSPQGFSIVAEIVPFQIASVSPNAVGAGEVTLRFVGSRFRADTAFALRPAGTQTLYTPTNVTGLTGSEALVTFDLTGAPLGFADAVAMDGMATVELSNAVTIEASTDARLLVEISDGPRLRFGVEGERLVTLTNAGNVDVAYADLEVVAWNFVGLQIEVSDGTSSVPLTSRGNMLGANMFVAGIGVGQQRVLRLSILAGAGYPAPNVGYSARAIAHTKSSFRSGPLVRLSRQYSQTALDIIPDIDVEDSIRDELFVLFSNESLVQAQFEQYFDTYGWNPTEGPRGFGQAGCILDCAVQGAICFAFCIPGGGGPTPITAACILVCQAIKIRCISCCANNCLSICFPSRPCTCDNEGPPPPPACPPPDPCPGRAQDNDNDGKCDPPGGALDPNEKVGPVGFGAEQWVARSQTLPYQVFFENVSSATAPASVVTITDDLDPALNPGSFRVGTIRFGDVEVLVPENRINFQTTLDFVDTKGILLEITAGVDATRTPAQAFWVFRSIDPRTGLPPVDANLGFLPPNDETGRGQGVVEYTIRPRSNTPNATVVENTADIVFDVNDVIRTNTVFNTIDPNLPFSEVADLPPASAPGNLELSIPANDAPEGSGLRGVRLLVSTDGGPFVPVGDLVTGPTTTFLVEAGHVYRFASQAIDNAGNAETVPSLANPDAITTVPDVRFADGVDTGVVGDALTRLRTPTFVLVGPPLSTVDVDLSGPTPLTARVQIGAAGLGTWVVPAPLLDGAYTLSSNAAGVVAQYAFTVDSTPPVLAGWTSESTHAGTTVGLTIAPLGQSSEPRAAGIGTVVVRLADAEPSLESLPPLSPSDVLVTGTDASGRSVDLSLVNKTVALREDGRSFEIRFTPSLPDRARYCITLRNVTDTAGNPLGTLDARRSVAALVGDAFEDLRVNNTDVGGIQSLLGTTVVPTVVNHVRSDTNGDGLIDTADRAIVLPLRGTDLRAVADPCAGGRASTTRAVVSGSPQSDSDASGGSDSGSGNAGTDGPSGGHDDAAPGGPSDSGPSETDETQDASGITTIPNDWTLIATRLAVLDVRGFGNIRLVIEPLGWSATDAEPWAARGWWMLRLNGRDPREAARTLCGAGLFAAPVYETPEGETVVGPSIVITAASLREAESALREVDPAAQIMSHRAQGRDAVVTATLSGCDGFRVLGQILALTAKDGIKSISPSPVPSSEETALGDVNRNGLVDAEDLAELMRLIQASDADGDLNSDGSLDRSDAEFMLELLSR